MTDGTSICVAESDEGVERPEDGVKVGDGDGEGDGDGDGEAGPCLRKRLGVEMVASCVVAMSC